MTPDLPRQVLLVSEIALAVVLLVGAELVLKSLSRLQAEVRATKDVPR